MVWTILVGTNTTALVRVAALHARGRVATCCAQCSTLVHAHGDGSRKSRKSRGGTRAWGELERETQTRVVGRQAVSECGGDEEGGGTGEGGDVLAQLASTHLQHLGTCVCVCVCVCVCACVCVPRRRARESKRECGAEAHQWQHF